MYPEPEKGGKGKRSRIQEGLDLAYPVGRAA
jgi:hypothetical protein